MALLNRRLTPALRQETNSNAGEDCEKKIPRTQQASRRFTLLSTEWDHNMPRQPTMSTGRLVFDDLLDGVTLYVFHLKP
jgi:hypothetical protein